MKRMASNHGKHITKMRKIIMDQVFSGDLMKKLKPLNQLKKDDINKINEQNQKVHIRSNSCSTIESIQIYQMTRLYQ